MIDLADRKVARTVGLAGVPGWPFSSHDGGLVIVTTFDEQRELGFVELLDSGDMTVAAVVEVPDEPFHALPEPDGRHVLVALANGEITRIDFAGQTDRRRWVLCRWNHA